MQCLPATFAAIQNAAIESASEIAPPPMGMVESAALCPIPVDNFQQCGGNVSSVVGQEISPTANPLHYQIAIEAPKPDYAHPLCSRDSAPRPTREQHARMPPGLVLAALAPTRPAAVSALHTGNAGPHL